MSEVAKARVFQSGNSQAVRLPKRFHFRSPVVDIYRRGDEIVLREGVATLAEAFDLLAGMSDDYFSSGRKDNARLERRGKLKA